jgi:uncharacterized small protein (DUF1192 family)
MLLTPAALRSTFLHMDNDDIFGLQPSDPLNLLIRQDLDPFSVDELRERIIILTKEIARITHKIEDAIAHRAGADALFKQ